jgi:hypothetical protein
VSYELIGTVNGVEIYSYAQDNLDKGEFSFSSGERGNIVQAVERIGSTSTGAYILEQVRREAGGKIIVLQDTQVKNDGGKIPSREVAAGMLNDGSAFVVAGDIRDAVANAKIETVRNGFVNFSMERLLGHELSHVLVDNHEPGGLHDPVVIIENQIIQQILGVATTFPSVVGLSASQIRALAEKIYPNGWAMGHIGIDRSAYGFDRNGYPGSGMEPNYSQAGRDDSAIAGAPIRRTAAAIDDILDRGGAVTGAAGNVIEASARVAAGVVDLATVAAKTAYEMAMKQGDYPDPIIRAATVQKQDSAMDRGTGGTGSPTGGGGNPTGGTGTPRGSGGGGADAGQAANPAPRRDGAGRTPDDPRFTGPRPILLDLDGDGVQITEFGKSSQFTPGADGLQHRSSWAGAGNGVLFFDPDGRNAITEQRQYVFTEWNPTASGDLEALRSVWDTNGDGKLTAADTEFAKFKVLVTNADGSTTVMTLAQLGVTAINLTANAVNIGLPDGSTITGQTTFTRANGTTGVVANTTLVAEADGHRVVELVATDGSGNRVVTQTGYGADGGVAFRIVTTTSPSGNAVLRLYDDNGDGVTDREMQLAA